MPHCCLGTTKIGDYWHQDSLFRIEYEFNKVILK